MKQRPSSPVLCLAIGILASCSAMITVTCAGEDLNGPPITTCPAWAIAEGSTGKIIASENGDEPLKAASTTKVMCALVVLEQAKNDPAVLEEQVTFSKLADATEGSTAGINAGE